MLEAGRADGYLWAALATQRPAGAGDTGEEFGDFGICWQEFSLSIGVSVPGNWKLRQGDELAITPAFNRCLRSPAWNFTSRWSSSLPPLSLGAKHPIPSPKPILRRLGCKHCRGPVNKTLFFPWNQRKHVSPSSEHLLSPRWREAGSEGDPLAGGHPGGTPWQEGTPTSRGTPRRDPLSPRGTQEGPPKTQGPPGAVRVSVSVPPAPTPRGSPDRGGRSCREQAAGSPTEAQKGAGPSQSYLPSGK